MKTLSRLRAHSVWFALLPAVLACAVACGGDDDPGGDEGGAGDSSTAGAPAGGGGAGGASATGGSTGTGGSEAGATAGGTAGVGGSSNSGGAGGSSNEGGAPSGGSGGSGGSSAGTGGTGGDGGSGGTGGSTGELHLPCDVDQLLTERCRSCHSDPPSGPPFALVTLDDVVEHADMIQEVLELDNMPAEGPPLDDDEKAIFYDWIEAGTPGSSEDCSATP